MSGRILVVDDDRVIRQLIKVNLELEGFEVITAADGAECLDVVHGVRPDLVTLDVVMPRLDGLRTAERLRSDPRTRHIPVAIISGCSRLGGGKEPGPPVDALLAKPFEPSELVRMVKELTGSPESGEPGGRGSDGASRPPGAGPSEPTAWSLRR